MLIFTARNDAKESVEEFLNASGTDKSSAEYANMIRGSIGSLDTASMAAWATSQAHISLGFSLAAAADLRIGACPMSGFLPDGVHKVLKLPNNEVPVAYLAIGSKDDDNSSAIGDKFRFELDYLVKYHR